MPSRNLDDLNLELQQALDSLTPQIRGLDDLMLVNLSPDSHTAAAVEDQSNKRRRDLLVEAVQGITDLTNDLVRLVADGYPDAPKAIVSAAIFAEMQQELANFTAAVAQFQPQPVAAKLSISLGDPQPKS